MTVQPNTPPVQRIDPAVFERLTARHTPDPQAMSQDVDIISDPNRQDDDGYNWTRLRVARAVAAVVPGASVVVGSAIGRYPAKVVAWDFEVSDDDPIVTLELLG